MKKKFRVKNECDLNIIRLRNEKKIGHLVSLPWGIFIFIFPKLHFDIEIKFQHNEE